MINLVVWIVPGSTNDCSSSLCCATWSGNGHFGVPAQLATVLGSVAIDWEQSPPLRGQRRHMHATCTQSLQPHGGISAQHIIGISTRVIHIGWIYGR